jgi:hypothetical protein
MNEQEWSELEPNEQDVELNLDDIMKEFAADEERDIQETSAQEILEAALSEAGVRLDEEPETLEEDDTVLFERPEKKDDTVDYAPAEEWDDTISFDPVEVSGDTLSFDPVEDGAEAADDEEELGDTLQFGKDDMEAIRQAAEQVEPYSEKWEPEYDQPMGEYVPPQPIVFRPRSRLRELKRKLVAGPEKRYYELAELGLGRLQAAIFLCVIVVLLSGGALLLNGLGMVRADRMRLMVFGQVLGMLVAALLGSFQLINGGASLLKGRFTSDTMLLFTFIACCVDGVVCLMQLRVPYCAAFSLEVMMSLWAEYQRRNTEMGQMDTMRKAIRLDSVVKCDDFYDGRPGLLRAEGQVEDFMDNYAAVSAPEKVLSRFMLIGMLVALAVGVAGGLFHWDYQMGIRLGTAAMLAVAPATAFITLTRPAAVLERRLHWVGAVICGWQGVMGLQGPVTVPMADRDLFPAGTVKMNGVKFFGSREPDQVVAYATALMAAEGEGLSDLFNSLLDSRNGRHYDVENFRAYNGGLGGEVEGEPVLIGTHTFLRDMGVEVPEGTRVQQALYVAIDGELGGVFAVNYGKHRPSVMGLGALCGYRSLTPVLTCSDFMLTESFLRSKFGVNTRRVAFPNHDVRKELAAKKPAEDAKSLALTTGEGILGMAFAVTGARTLRTASVFGVTLHMVAGILGLIIVALLAVVGAEELLTAENLMLFELLWMIPGLLITEWTRNP